MVEIDCANPEQKTAEPSLVTRNSLSPSLSLSRVYVRANRRKASVTIDEQLGSEMMGIRDLPWQRHSRFVFIIERAQWTGVHTETRWCEHCHQDLHFLPFFFGWVKLFFIASPSYFFTAMSLIIISYIVNL